VIGLLQRVRQARIEVQNQNIAEIGIGLLVFVGVEKNDDENKADRLLQRLLGYRVFSDKQGKMNLNVTEVDGAVLLVPQFTLAADTNKGMRPGFSQAANTERGELLFNYLLKNAHSRHSSVASGLFGANMQVSLTNDGPVTFSLQV
jgi:D-tyrosyl-tRNA(Tyr) deacylase